MNIKNVLLLVLAGSTVALMASNLRSISQYTELKEDALAFRQDCNWFSMDVLAVDAETGEPVARAGLDHRGVYPLDPAEQISFPRLSRIYCAEQGCTKISGIAQKPLTLVVSAPDYKETEFEVVPDPSKPDQGSLIVKLEKKYKSELH